MQKSIRAGCLLALLVLAVSAGACRESTLYPNRVTGDRNSEETEKGLTLHDVYGIEWRLESFEDLRTGDVTNVPDGQSLTLTFTQDGVGGSSDCNAYGGNYSAGDDGTISITNIITTYVACGPGSLEGPFITGLQEATSYRITNQALRLYNADKSQLMRFSNRTRPVQLMELELVNFAASTPYTTTSASIDGDVLGVGVQYSGGCEEHEFFLYGPTTIPDGDPANITLFLIHESNKDFCEALISETRQFDLTPLKNRWQEVRGETSGEISINIHDAHTGIVRNVLYSFGGAKSGSGGVTPQWLKDTITAIKSRPAGNPRVQIYQYEYNGATVYYRTAPCCDIFTDLYDENGNILCHPDGGFSGSGDMQCSDFLSTRKNGVLVWKDSR